MVRSLVGPKETAPSAGVHAGAPWGFLRWTLDATSTTQRPWHGPVHPELDLLD